MKYRIYQFCNPLIRDIIHHIFRVFVICVNGGCHFASDEAVFS